MNSSPNETRIRASYDGAVILIGAVLLIVVVGLAVYLVAVAVSDAPVVAAIFGVLGSFVLIGLIFAVISFSRWAITQNAAVHGQVAQASAQAFGQSTTAMLDYLKQQQLAAPTVTTYLPPNRAPELPAATSIPRIRVNGQPIGVKLQTIAENGTLLTCSPEGLEAALKLLAEGEQPTRENFKRKGIYSSTEIAGVVDWLAGQGQITKSGQGAATRWANGVTPASVGALADEYRVYCPSLPYFISQSFVEDSLTGAGQVGQQAGRQVVRGRK